MTIPSPVNLGIGVIGVGRHGSRYVNHLLRDVPGITLAALCRRRSSQGSGNIHLPAIPVYGDYHALITDPNVHAIVVVTPPTLCHDVCLAAIRASKPLLIEKPLAPSAHEARAMVLAANQANVLLMTAHTMRFDPTIDKVKELLPRIGILRSARMTSHIEFTSGTVVSDFGQRGALLEIGIHLLDAIRYLTGDEVRAVQCEMDPVPPAGPELRASVALETQRGIKVQINIARVPTGRIAHMTWVGTSGQLNADWSHCGISLMGSEGISEQWTVEARPTILAALEAFILAIRTKTRPPVTGEDGQRAVEIAEACYQSAARGGALAQVAYSP